MDPRTQVKGGWSKGSALENIPDRISTRSFEWGCLRLRAFTINSRCSSRRAKQYNNNAQIHTHNTLQIREKFISQELTTTQRTSSTLISSNQIIPDACKVLALGSSLIDLGTSNFHQDHQEDHYVGAIIEHQAVYSFVHASLLNF